MYLGEANVLGLLTEALTAQVEVVLADETGLVLADAAINRNVSPHPYQNHIPSLHPLLNPSIESAIGVSYQAREPLP